MKVLTRIDLWFLTKVTQLGKLVRRESKPGRHRTDNGTLSTMQSIIKAQNGWGYRPMAFTR